MAEISVGQAMAVNGTKIKLCLLACYCAKQQDVGLDWL